MPTLKLLGYDEDGYALYEIDYNDNGNIIFKWSKVSGATSYKVYRSGYMNGSYKLLGETKNTTFTDTTATAGYYYYYKIVAVSSRSSYADSAAFKVVAAPCYPQVKNLRNVSVSNGVSFKWDPIKGVDGYIIVCGYTKDIEEMSYVGETTSAKFSDSSLPKGMCYAVIAVKIRSDGVVITSMPAYITAK